MAEPTYDKSGLEFLATQGAPVPGESLTNNPEQPFPWEQAPQYTTIPEALDATFIELTQPETYQDLIKLIRQGVPIGNVADIIIYKGFSTGLWNPDLALMLLEPVMYMLIALATHAGIDEPVLDDESDEADETEQLTEIQKAMEVAKDKIIPKLRGTEIPKDIQQRVEQLEIPEESEKSPSLLSRKEQE